MADMNFGQVSTVLNNMAKQAKAANTIMPVTYEDFVSVGKSVLATGYDNVIHAINQVLTDTIFSERPFPERYLSLRADSHRWGNHLRKISFLDREAQDDPSYTLQDGASIDQWKMSLPGCVQLNFYDQHPWEYRTTYFRNQLDAAFNGPDELARFFTGETIKIYDAYKLDVADTARGMLNNIALAHNRANTGNVYHLVTLYNQELHYDGQGANPAAKPYYELLRGENFKPFIQWCYAFCKHISDHMEEPSRKFHINLTGKPITRHTPKGLQKLFLLDKFVGLVDAVVKPDVYHDEYLRYGAFESVPFWQAFDDPMTIKGSFTTLNADGTTTVIPNTDSKATLNNVVGILIDDEAAMYNIVNEWSASTPINIDGGYYNSSWHYNKRWMIDLTENAAIFCMD